MAAMSEGPKLNFQFGILTLFGAATIVGTTCAVARISGWAAAPAIAGGILCWGLVAAVIVKRWILRES
jgi:uncharacterized membrane protein (DUF441 family)